MVAAARKDSDMSLLRNTSATQTCRVWQVWAAQSDVHAIYTLLILTVCSLNATASLLLLDRHDPRLRWH